MPAASEIRNAGTCVTSPSPIVSVVNSDAGLAEAHAVLDDADEQPADDVDQDDDDAGDGVAADELAGPVHRAEEVGLLRDFAGGGAAPRAGRSRRRSGRRRSAICLPGIPSSVNRAATSLMRVAPFGDDHELDQDDDREDNQPDDDLVGARRRRR